MANQVKWLLDEKGEKLAKCGNWVAELAYNEIYSEGLVFIRYKNKDTVPAYWGQPKSAIHDKERSNLVALIQEVCQAMVAGLECSQPCKCRCQNVYIVSLNEGDFENVQQGKPFSLGVHFRLLPRYQHDEYFLKRLNADGRDNDGFAVMAEWREQVLLRKKTGKWGWFPQTKDDNPRAWSQYVGQIKRDLKNAVKNTKKKSVRARRQDIRKGEKGRS